MSQALRAPDSAEAVELFEEFRRTGDREVRNKLVVMYSAVAIGCARQFADRGESFDDLVQVAMYGLLKSVDRFDPSRGVPFAGFASPTVTGELRRYFRDATWAVHVPRRAKDLQVRLRHATERMTAEHSQPPSPEELSSELGVSVDDVMAALDASVAYRPTSIDGSPSVLASTTFDGAATDESTARVNRLLLQQLLATLSERDRTVVGMRFFEDLSQQEIADRVGVSQVQISRILRKALRSMHRVAVGDGQDQGDEVDLTDGAARSDGGARSDGVTDLATRRPRSAVPDDRRATERYDLRDDLDRTTSSVHV